VINLEANSFMLIQSIMLHIILYMACYSTLIAIEQITDRVVMTIFRTA